MTKANIFEAMFIVVAIAVVGAGSVGVTLLLTGDSDNSNSDSSQMQDAPSNQEPRTLPPSYIPCPSSTISKLYR